MSLKSFIEDLYTDHGCCNAECDEDLHKDIVRYVHNRSRPLLAPGMWNEQGGPVEFRGNAVDIDVNDVGDTVVVGAPFDAPSGPEDSGRVYVYRFAGASWVLLGGVLSSTPGSGKLSRFGASVAISATDRIVVGVPERDGGEVFVYEYKDGHWNQLGDAIADCPTNSRCGESVDISDDGNIIAVGASFANNGDDLRAGRVRFYRWDPGCVSSFGGWCASNPIYGDSPQDYFGHSVSLSRDGAVAAVGSWLSDTEGVGSGYVKTLYGTVSPSLEYTQFGSTLRGQTRDNFGFSVRLDDTGTELAIGAPQRDGGNGYVRTYKWNGFTTWTVGPTVYGQQVGGYFGQSLDMNYDGSFIVVSAPYESTHGVVRSYAKDADGETWMDQYNTIEGSQVVSMNGPGDILCTAVFLTRLIRRFVLNVVGGA